MALEQWGRLVRRRFGRYLMALFGVREEYFIMEEDPVGEFLSRKGENAGQSEDEGSPMPAMANPEVQAAEVGTENFGVQRPAVEDREQTPSGPEEVAENPVEMPFDANEEQLAQLEDEVSGVAAVTDADPLALEVGSESIEIAATPDAAPQMLEVESQSAEGADPAQRKEAPENGEDDSLLEVFRSERVSESPISVLSRELTDTSVHSLLDEMKGIAKKVRKRP